MFLIVTDVNNALGECPLWCEKTRRVFWTDIECSELLAFEEESGIVKRWSLPERAGSFALTGKADVLLIGLASQLAFYDLNTEVLTPVASSPGMTGRVSGMDGATALATLSLAPCLKVTMFKNADNFID